MPMIRMHVSIRGLVQGVFFRASTRDEAQSLGIKGWVKNCPDGTVEAVFEGEKKSVEQMVKWCRKGPQGASVSHVEEHQEKCVNEFDTFSVAY